MKLLLDSALQVSILMVHEHEKGHHVYQSKKNIIPLQMVPGRLVKPTAPVRYVALPRNRRENQCLVGTRKSPHVKPSSWGKRLRCAGRRHLGSVKSRVPMW